MTKWCKSCYISSHQSGRTHRSSHGDRRLSRCQVRFWFDPCHGWDAPRWRIVCLRRTGPRLRTLRHVFWPCGLLARIVAVTRVPTTVEVGFLAAIGTLEATTKNTENNEKALKKNPLKTTTKHWKLYQLEQVKNFSIMLHPIRPPTPTPSLQQGKFTQYWHDHGLSDIKCCTMVQFLWMSPHQN